VFPLPLNLNPLDLEGRDSGLSGLIQWWAAKVLRRLVFPTLESPMK